MNSVRVKSYAKINLTLDIVGVKDGYHMIDSVVASIDLCDVITAKKRSDGLVSVTMHGEGSEAIPHENNNAAKAAEEFVKRFGCAGADITVWKNIPMGAGLGGSSADVAGVLNAMAKLYGVSDFAAVKDIADGLGSDCGYMLTGGWARISGRGQIVKRLDSNLKFDIGLLVPKSGVSTAECYRVCDDLPRGAMTSGQAENAVLACDREGLCASLSNGLTAAAVKLNGDVGECISELESFAPLGVNMTGSGSGVYAVFENDMFLRYAQSRYRGKYRFIPTKTVLAVREEKDG
ncbi:MAG: hypothetical protein K2K04_03420 [Clostridia bacterium]|nr:hypothetical protein [Clostridia bacterium]